MPAFAPAPTAVAPGRGTAPMEGLPAAPGDTTAPPGLGAWAGTTDFAAPGEVTVVADFGAGVCASVENPTFVGARAAPGPEWVAAGLAAAGCGAGLFPAPAGGTRGVSALEVVVGALGGDAGPPPPP
jgi:hypothetical protein